MFFTRQNKRLKVFTLYYFQYEKTEKVTDMETLSSGPIRQAQVVCICYSPAWTECWSEHYVWWPHWLRDTVPELATLAVWKLIPQPSSLGSPSFVTLQLRPFRPLCCTAPAGTSEGTSLASDYPWTCFQTRLTDSSRRTEILTLNWS